MKQRLKRVASALLIVCLLSPDFVPLAKWASVLAADEENNMEITQCIEKYIPYSNSDTDKGVILQQSVSTKLAEEVELSESKIIIDIPTYAEISPEKIDIATEQMNVTEDNSQNQYYEIKDGILTIYQKEQINDKYYITYYYSEDAYVKYLESTHLNEYENGKILNITKDELTGDVWVYIDYEWDPDEHQGENPPENMRLLEKTPIQINAKIEWTNETYTNSEESALTQELDIMIGNFINNDISISLSEITKSELYSKNDISYITENKINITRSDICGNIKISDLGTSFISKDNINNPVDTYYKKLRIKKTDFEKVLDETSNINIIDEGNNIIGTINGQTQVDENGDFVFTYPEDNTLITLEITGIKNDGFLNFKQERVINGDNEYAKSQIINFAKYRLSMNSMFEDNLGNTQDIEQIVEILLTETLTSANLKLNNTNLSTDIENSGLEFSIELKNNNIQSDLWDNPFFILEMPEEVESVTINNHNVVYGEGLTLHSVENIELNGNQALKIQLYGMQEDFVSNTIVGGTTVVLNANIKLKELTPTSNDKTIKLYYYNESKTNYENSTKITLEEEYEVGYNTLNVNYLAPIGFKTIHKMSGFDTNGTVINSENSEKEMGKLAILENEKQVQQTIILMNNTGNETTDIKVLGRIPFVGNTDILSDEDLQTTVNTILSNSINYSGEKEIQIYYSENGVANTDLENAENGWSLEVNNWSKITTFMIVISNMLQGEKIFLDYEITVPEMLEHNENMYSSLVTYYTNNTEIGSIEEKSKANKIGLTTGVGARAKIELSAGIDTGATLIEGQKIKYKLTVTNTGELTAKDVVVLNPIPEGATYLEEQFIENELQSFNKYTYYSSENTLQWEIGELAVNQTAELEYTLIVNSIPTILEYYGSQEGFIEENGEYYIIEKNEAGQEIQTKIEDLPDITINNKAILKASNIEKEIVSNELKNDVRKSYFIILEESSIEKNIFIEQGQEYQYNIIIENKTDVPMQNLQITKYIPEGITYKNAEILAGNGVINFENNIFIATIEQFEGYGVIELKINVVANKLKENEYKKEIITKTEVKAEGIEANTSSSVTNTIGKPKLKAKLECAEKQRYVYEQDVLNYTITVTNENDVTASKLVLTDIIPEGTKFVMGSYIKNENEYTILSDGTRNVVLETNLKQETIIVKIQVQIEDITTNVEEVEIINKAIMSATSIEETEIGEIKHIVLNTGDNNQEDDGYEEGNKPSKPNDGQIGDDGIERFKIKGSVWEDSNKDGQRQDNEDIISGVNVYLINEKGEIVKDYQTGEDKKFITSLDGEYEFRNIEKGNYIVVYTFDNNKYNITEYQKNGVVADRNSDAILKTIIFEGKEQQAAVTDIIEVKDRNLYSIDLGLKHKEKFNMKLEAGISSITVKTKNGTTQTAYDMADLAKIEIKSQYINGATVKLEYTVKITNNGEIAGSVSQIITNKVKELNFSSSANEYWYEGNDGYIYLTGLTNHILQPGENTEVRLILVKQMTTSNMGTIENNFTITKTYNNLGQEESTFEDNSEKVTCIITISTGATLTYTGIILLALSILAIGIFEIKRKFTEEKRWI